MNDWGKTVDSKSIGDFGIHHMLFLWLQEYLGGQFLIFTKRIFNLNGDALKIYASQGLPNVSRAGNVKKQAGSDLDSDSNNEKLTPND